MSKRSVVLARLVETDPRVESYEFDDQSEIHWLNLAEGFRDPETTCISITARKVSDILESLNTIGKKGE